MGRNCLRRGLFDERSTKTDKTPPERDTHEGREWGKSFSTIARRRRGVTKSHFCSARVRKLCEKKSRKERRLAAHQGGGAASGGPGLKGGKHLTKIWGRKKSSKKERGRVKRRESASLAFFTHIGTGIRTTLRQKWGKGGGILQRGKITRAGILEYNRRVSKGGASSEKRNRQKVSP